MKNPTQCFITTIAILFIASLSYAGEDVDTWRYTLERPADGWYESDFDDTAWVKGAGGFGTRSTPGARVGTVWETDDIWLRKAFKLATIPNKPALLIHHDEDAVVYVNGQSVAKLKGYTREYGIAPIEKRSLLTTGQNVLAVHCHQTRGGQFIDVRVIDAADPPTLPQPSVFARLDTSNDPAPIQTPWDSQIDPENVLPEYPRPQLVREAWQNLNGWWEWAITKKDGEKPAGWEGKILVPFCFEADLSGVNRLVQDDEWMWYRRSFTVPTAWKGQRVWLNFQASDWETVVDVNGQEVGQHRGGYTPFSLDITDHLVTGRQELVVRVWDHGGREAFCSAGKQTQGGVYEPCSGIWQTVWLEPRPSGAVTSMKIRASLREAAVTVSLKTDGRTPEAAVANVQVLEGDTPVADATGPMKSQITVPVPNPKPWQPDNPFLYGLRIELLSEGQTIDSISSYCGLRDISIDKSLKGPQIVLNGKALFHFGPLDQGYWPLSTLTPPTEDALVYELDYLKQIGCNMVRLHIKRNPSRWYYHCDRLGLLVWQDFICNKKYRDPTPGESQVWKSEQLALMDSLNNHPSVVKWIVFNEGWGQHDTQKVVKWAQELLSNHVVSAASGWTDVDHLGHIRDIHDYSRFPSTTLPDCEPNRAVVLGETGGFGVPVNGNNWLQMPEPREIDMKGGQVRSQDRRGGMYPVKGSADNDFISDIKRPVYSLAGQPPQYARYVETLRLEQAHGLSGAVYTQLTDMRHEQNGWLTFDRKVSKIPVAELRAIHETLYQPVQMREPLLPTGSQWTDASGEAVVFPIQVAEAVRQTQPGGKKRERKAVRQPASKTQVYLTRFEVQTAPENAVLNLFLDAQHDTDTFGYLLVHLDNKLIYDDMSRHKKAEHRVTCVSLTSEQTALLTSGTHELKVEVVPSIAIHALDISLDAVVSE